MKQYKDMIQRIMTIGRNKPDRTGTGTQYVFGHNISIDLRRGFPLLTTKKVHFKSVVGELLWFLSGSTSAKELREKYGVTIWDEWQDEDGDLGPIYGAQWRDFDGVDQIQWVLDEIKKDPNSRSLIVSAWSPADLEDMALRPCHTMFQFDVSNTRLSCQVYQRSADVFLGVPFNIASYALLTHMFAHVLGLEPFLLKFAFGNAHIYNNHKHQCLEILQRNELELPTIELNPNVTDIFSFTPDDINLVNYQSHPAIRGDVAV